MSIPRSADEIWQVQSPSGDSIVFISYEDLYDAISKLGVRAELVFQSMRNLRGTFVSVGCFRCRLYCVLPAVVVRQADKCSSGFDWEGIYD